VNRVVAADALMNSATEMMRQILANGPLAVAACIEAVNVGFDISLDAALSLEASLFGMLAGTADMKEGTQAFLEKRAAAFTGK
jgi:enoyl-CoA hydratase